MSNPKFSLELRLAIVTHYLNSTDGYCETANRFGVGRTAVRRWVSLPFGPHPTVFIPLMLTIGLLCLWLGTLCWNTASQRLSTVLMGPLIVFEILFGLLWTFLWHRRWPSQLTVTGIVCLMAGVLWAMRIKPQPLLVAIKE